MSEPDIQSSSSESDEETELTTETSSGSEEDTILDRLLSDGDETSVSSTPAKAEKTTQVSADTQANPDRQKAISILKRDGVPQAVIDGVSDEVLAEWVAKASKRQNDVDGYHSKMMELEKKVAASSKTAEESDDDLIIDDGEDAEPSDDEEQSDSVNDERSDDDEPVGKSKSIKKMEAELAELRKSQQEFQQQALQYQVDVAESTLRQLYGDRSPERDAVISEMNRLGSAKPGSYQTMLQLAQEAYTNLAGPLNRTASRKATQPTVGNRVARNERPVSPADAEDAILDAIMDGKSAQEARLITRK